MTGSVYAINDNWSKYAFKNGAIKQENNIPEEFLTSNKISLIDRINILFQYLNENNCTIEDEGRTREFLVANSNIIFYLWQALIQIWKKFGKERKIAISLLFEDKKFMNQGELFLSIKAGEDIKEDYEKINQVENDWFLKINNSHIKFLNISLEF